MEEPGASVGSWRARVLSTLLALLLLAVVITAGTLVYDRFTRHDDPAPVPADIGKDGPTGPPLGVSAVTTARRATVDFFTLDYRHLATAGRSLRAYSTADFRRQYDVQVAPLVKRVRSGRLVLSPRVPTDGIATEYLSEHTARVLVAVDVTTTASAGRRDTTAYRIRVALQRDGVRWLVAGIDQVG